MNLDQKYNDEPVQVRVTMGKEPRHFMAMFRGRLVIFEVGRLPGSHWHSSLWTVSTVCRLLG